MTVIAVHYTQTYTSATAKIIMYYWNKIYTIDIAHCIPTTNICPENNAIEKTMKTTFELAESWYWQRLSQYSRYCLLIIHEAGVNNCLALAGCRIYDMYKYHGSYMD